MNTTSSPEIWTVGHSNRTMDDFLAVIRSFSIEILADIRSFPGSASFPHFNKRSLEKRLPDAGIEYIHLPDLGGRRKSVPSPGVDIRADRPFQGYAGYIKTAQFSIAATHLEQMAGDKRLVYMCSEAVWWRCHRSLVSDYLKSRGWLILHITGLGKATEHPLANTGKVQQGTLF